jgi:hypothetical protein
MLVVEESFEVPGSAVSRRSRSEIRGEDKCNANVTTKRTEAIECRKVQ